MGVISMSILAGRCNVVQVFDKCLPTSIMRHNEGLEHIPIYIVEGVLGPGESSL